MWCLWSPAYGGGRIAHSSKCVMLPSDVVWAAVQKDAHWWYSQNLAQIHGSNPPCVNTSGWCWWCNGVRNVLLPHFGPVNTNQSLFACHSLFEYRCPSDVSYNGYFQSCDSAFYKLLFAVTICEWKMTSSSPCFFRVSQCFSGMIVWRVIIKTTDCHIGFTLNITVRAAVFLGAWW